MQTSEVYKSWLCVSFTTLIHHKTPVLIVSSKGKVLICQHTIDIDHVHPAPHVGTSCHLQIVWVENLLTIHVFQRGGVFQVAEINSTHNDGDKEQTHPLVQSLSLQGSVAVHCDVSLIVKQGWKGLPGCLVWSDCCKVCRGIVVSEAPLFRIQWILLE